MRIKRTLASRYKGKRYHTHRLVHAVREGTRVRELILLNLGVHYSEPKENWYAICQRLEELMHPGMQGEMEFYQREPEIELPAVALAERLHQSLKDPNVELTLSKLRRRAS